MVLSPRQAVQQVNDKLEEWWGRFVTPDGRRRAAMDADDDEDDNNIHENGDDDNDEQEEENRGGRRRRLSILVNKLFQEARLLPQFVEHLRLPQLPPLRELREQLSAYFAYVGAQIDRLPPLVTRIPMTLPQLPLRRDQFPDFPQLPASMEELGEMLPKLPQLSAVVRMQDLNEMAFSCWEVMEMSYKENQVVYQRRLIWGSVTLFYLLVMLVFSSQCCHTTSTTNIATAESVAAVVYNPQQHRQEDHHNNTLSSSPSSSVSTDVVRRLEGACASTSLSASNKYNMENVIMGGDNGDDQQLPPPPPPPLWFTFVRITTNQATRPTLPPIALRMVRDMDGYYIDEDHDGDIVGENRTILPPPNGTTISKTSSSSSSLFKSMDVAGVNIAMEEEREKEIKNNNNGILYPAAFTPQPIVRKQDVGFLHAWSRRIETEIPDIVERSLRVSWGGGNDGKDDDGYSSLWWQERNSIKILLAKRKASYFSWWKSFSSSSSSSSSAAAAAAVIAAKDPLQDIDGGHLLYSYYQVLLPQFMKDPSKVSFPRHNLGNHLLRCPENGCSTHVAIQHTLEFRESYQPWRPTASMVKENQQGWIYARGLARTPIAAAAGSAASTKEESTTTSITTTNNTCATVYAGQHAMIWARPGQHSIKDPQAYNRAILQTLEQGIATSLKHSYGQVGRFNVVIDASGLEWSKLPDMVVMKQLLHILQDHYPRRLGAIFMFNLPPSSFLFLTFILKTFIDREVRQKIYLLSRNPVQRLAQLESVVDIKDIPTWIQGGQDSYEFNASTYYSSPKTRLDDDFDKKETKEKL